FELNTELLGLSVDSVASHISWISDIERSFNTKIEFPVIADLNKKVANKYGMVMPESNDTSTSRAVFLIDPEGTVRAVIYYPLTTGRNSEEIIRLVKALQTTDKHGVSTPIDRSEEHTSELQSRFDLVCRLLLEKKNKKTKIS